MSKSALINTGAVISFCAVVALAIASNETINITLKDQNSLIDILGFVAEWSFWLYGFKKVLDNLVDFFDKLRSKYND